MVLEATMVVLDNSDWMRNGDFLPTRTNAQTDSLGIIFRSKTASNPENTVGALTMAGNNPQVLTTFTTEMGKILTAANKSLIGGKAKFIQGVQVAQLSLKHRQNKNQKQNLNGKLNTKIKKKSQM